MKRREDHRMAASDGLDFSTVWTAAGVVVGFSVTAFMFRIGRESEVRTSGGRWWLPAADFVLILSLVVVLVGVFTLPVLGASLTFARYALGWAFLLLARYPFALAGHYEILLGQVPEERWKLYKGPNAVPLPWLTRQEAHVLLIIGVLTFVYFVAVVARVGSS